MKQARVEPATRCRPPPSPRSRLIAGYDQRMGADALGLRGLALGHAHARPRRPEAGHALAALLPARPRACRSTATATRSTRHDRINSAWSLCATTGRPAPLDTVEHLTGLQDQLPDHARLPRLQAARQQAARRLHERRPRATTTRRTAATRRSTSTRATRSWTASRRSTTSASATPTRTSTGSRRQQLFLDALKSRLARNLSITEIPRLIGAMKGNIEIARGGGGAPQMTEVQSYAGLAYGLPPGHLFRNSIDRVAAPVLRAERRRADDAAVERRRRRSRSSSTRT